MANLPILLKCFRGSVISNFSQKLINCGRECKKQFGSKHTKNILSPVFRPKGQENHPPCFGRDIHSVPNGKIAVVTLPKSGTNWLLPLIADSLGIEIVYPTHQSNDTRACAIGFHQRFSTIKYRDDLVYLVYLMRDIRDIIVSFYHYSQTEFYQKTNRSCLYDNLESFYFEHFLSTVVPTYDWMNHALDFIESGVPLMKYERLWDNPQKELERLFLRWGIEVKPEKIKAAISNNSIDKLKQTGKMTWRQIPKTHFRKGGYGHYVDVMPEIVLKDVHHRFGAYLQRWGYPIGPEIEGVNTNLASGNEEHLRKFKPKT